MSHKIRSLASHRTFAHTPTAPACRLLISTIAALALPALALGVTVLLAFSAAAAQAEPPKLISYGSFASGFTAFGIGVGVDQSSGDVYASGLLSESGGLSPSSVNEFDASGKLLSPPSPFGEGFYSDAAVNPTNGDVYLLTNGNTLPASGNQAIDTYDPSSGAPLSSFPVAGSGNFFFGLTVVQIATDSAGDVYVPVVSSNDVQEYSPSGTPLETFTGSGSGALSGPTGVAVSSSGDVWVADSGSNRVEEFSPTGAFIGEIKSEGVQAVALDAHGDVFAIVKNGADFCGALQPPCLHLVEYSSAGAQLADIGAGAIGVVGESLPSMLAVNDSSGRVYVSDPLNNRVLIYGPPSAPVLGKELAAEVGTSEAKLGALVDPGGIETTYHFEYDTREYKEGEGPHGGSVPFPEGSVGQGVTPRTVWASASGLAPGTTYHYRVVATNELGTVAGADQTFTTETAAQAACPNEQLRGGFSASLPDCRAYELVTPPTQASTQPDSHVIGGFGFLPENHAASDGNRMAYPAIDILPGSQTGGENYVATRGASGWSSENVIPLQSYTALECNLSLRGPKMMAYSTDLSMGVLHDGGEDRRATKDKEEEGGCGAEVVEVVSGEPQGYENLLLRNNTDGAYQLINLTPPGVTPADAHFQGASSDLSHVVFSEHARLTANAPGGIEDLYEWSGGVVSLVTVLPNGAPAAGSLAEEAIDPGHPPLANAHAVSADGSHIFFTAGGDLYVRVNGASTVQVDSSQAGGSGGGGHFVDASVDGSQVFFTDDASADLTSDTVPGSGTNLYRYDLQTGRLSDLTPAGRAEVQRVSGISEDGSYVYFVADGVLTGSQENSEHAVAQAGQPNLYLRNAGSTTFIAIDPEVETNDEGFVDNAQISPNGAFLAFGSIRSLTGYDNTNGSGKLAEEVFLYSAASNQLVCASCNPSGEAPPGGESLPPQGGATLEQSSSRITHYLSDSGRLFFDTSDALVPSDTNGQTDVYEYESGQLHLISAGTGSSESLLLDASENGDDVFFLTRQKLLPQDTDEEAHSIYDARVDGGFPEPSVSPPCMTADACRAPVAPQPSVFGAPSSQTFSGAGNLVPPSEVKVKPKSKPAKCRPGFIKKRGRCARKPKHKAKKSAHSDKAGK